MKLGIISDTHDSLDQVSSTLKNFKSREVDLVMHLGDWKSISSVKIIHSACEKLGMLLLGVLGNNDDQIRAGISQKDNTLLSLFPSPDAVSFSIGNLSIALYHGQKESLKNELIQSGLFNLVILGHTHQIKVDKVNQTLVINPGSLAKRLPRQSSRVPTAAIINLVPLEIELIHFA